MDEAEEDKHEHEKDKPEDRIEWSQLEGSSFKWMKQRKTTMSTRKTSLRTSKIAFLYYVFYFLQGQFGAIFFTVIVKILPENNGITVNFPLYFVSK